VIRDEEGDVIAAGAGHLEHVRDALYAEAFASFQAIRAAAEFGMTKIILETDSMILQQAVVNDSYRLAHWRSQVLAKVGHGPPLSIQISMHMFIRAIVP
jgi:ribonuclease HI